MRAGSSLSIVSVPVAWSHVIGVRVTTGSPVPSSSTSVNEPSALGATRTSSCSGLRVASRSSRAASGRIPPACSSAGIERCVAVQLELAVALVDGRR